MAILDALVRAPSQGLESRFGFQDWVNTFTFDNHQYNLMGTLNGVKPDVPDPTFKSMVSKVHEQRGPVAAAVFARQLVLSQVRFRWNADGTLSDDASLRPLNQPGRSHRLMTMEGHASYAGNAVHVPVRGRRQLLDPTRISFVLGSDSDPEWDDDGQVQLPFDWTTIGIVYNSGNLNTAPNPRHLRTFLPGEYVHWMPEPDLANPWRGASWVVALIKDLALLGQIQESKSKFFTNAMTGNLIFISDKSKTADELKAFKQAMESRYAGTPNMWRNMYVGGVEDVKQVGQDIDKVGFRDLEGGIETLIGMRARIPTVIFGTREGQQGSALNAGNYGQARRNWSDMWFTPTVENLCEAEEMGLPQQDGRYLSHDPSKILFLQEDEKDAAEIMGAVSAALNSLVTAGFEADDAVDYLNTKDVRKLLGSHNGLPSVQQQAGRALELRDDLEERVGVALQAILTELRAGDRRPVTIQNTIPEVRVKLDAAEAIHIPAAEVHLHERELPPPVVNVSVPEQRQEAPIVNVNVPEQPAPVVNVTTPAPVVNVEVPPPPKVRHRVKRNQQGQITEIDEVAK